MNGAAAQLLEYISTCGCVLSAAGLKTITASSSPKEKEKDSPPADGDDSKGSELKLCHQCAKKFAQDDIIQLNPSPEEEVTLRFELERKRLLGPSKKKSKKRKNESLPDKSEPPTKKFSIATRTKPQE